MWSELAGFQALDEVYCQNILSTLTFAIVYGRIEGREDMYNIEKKALERGRQEIGGIRKSFQQRISGCAKFKNICG